MALKKFRYFQISIISVLLTLISIACRAQYYPDIEPDTLNKYNTKKYDIGYWIEYMNKYMYPTNKKEEAIYFRYSYYENGRRIFPPIPTNLNFEKLSLKIMDSSNSAKRDTVVLLDGKYRLYDKKGGWEEDYYQTGILMYMKTYYPGGQISESVDFTKKYKKEPFSCLCNKYTKNGKMEEREYIYFRNGVPIFVISNK